jgi:hypothetical protein
MGSDRVGSYQRSYRALAPAHGHQLGNAAGAFAICFDRHGRECRLHMPAFQQNDVKAGADPTGLVPLRQRPALEPNPLRPWSKLLEELHQGLWLTRHLELTRHCANGIHQTDAGEF